MRFPTIAVVAALLLSAGASAASAQLVAASEGRVVYGHHHLNVTDVAEHRRFWVDALGGTPTPLGQGELFKFTNVLVFVTERAPEGGTKGTTVNHIGFWVPSVRAALETVREAGYPIVTREELPASLEVDGRHGAHRRPGHLHRVRHGSGRGEGRAGREPGSGLADRHAPHPLRRQRRRRDEGVVRRDAGRRARDARLVPGGGPPRRQPDLVAQLRRPRRHPGPQPRPHRLRGRQPRGVLRGAGREGCHLRPAVRP